MKIFVMLYARQNLGDDLFLKMLIDKYPMEEFWINFVDEKYIKVIESYNNVVVMKNQVENFEGIDIDFFDGYIYIGGSIFMEGGKVYNLDNECNRFIKKCKEKNKPFFYVSSNFGPYRTKEYFELCKDSFKNCTDLCFRDIYSYNLFKEIDTVRYAPDLAFCYDIDIGIKEKNSIGISIIDLSIRKEKDKEIKYYKMLANNIIKYIESNNKVYLFSFCEYEGDEKAIKKLIEFLPNEYKEKLLVVNYNGNIDEFMNIYQKMEYMICTRFHAMVLSYICKHNMYVMSYSNKIDNVINELNLCKNENYCKIKDINESKIIDKNMFSKVDEANLIKIREEAKRQLLEIDKWIVK